MPFAPPPSSRRQVDLAGERIRRGETTEADVRLLEKWRASHLYIINTFQASLRNRRKRSSGQISIAQRLKRRPTIIDKLEREPSMALSRMHDIAGCRLIFEDIDKLRHFRASVHQSRAQHELIGGDDRYDYIAKPKPSGYRGVHDVYKYHVMSDAGEKWNGLRIEIQYRTLTQHAWATAVEISDIINSTRLKFGEAAHDLERLFILASELLARTHEHVPGHCVNLTDGQLVEEFRTLENKLRAIAHLRQLSAPEFARFAQTSRLFILVNPLPDNDKDKFYALGFYDSKSALERYASLEQEYIGRADVVLVGAREQDSVRLAYTNYFSDASEFLTRIDQALKLISPTVHSP